MGQKINPNIFRLSHTNNWDSNYIEKKSTDYSFHQIKDLEARKFIVAFLKKHGLNVHTLRLNYLNNNLNILIWYTKNYHSLSLINKINKLQRVKFLKNNFIGKKNLKKYQRVTKSIKKIFSYEQVNHRPYLRRNNFFKKNLLRKKRKGNGVINKKKRIKIIKHYKKYLTLRRNKSIKNLISISFIKKLLESLNLFFNRTYRITLIFKPLNYDIGNFLEKKQRKLLKKKFGRLRKFKHNFFFKEGVNLMFLSSLHRNSPDLIAKYIATTLKKLKKHNFFLRFVRIVLNMFKLKRFNSVAKSIKIKLKGRINGSGRSRRRVLKIGNYMPVLTLDAPISYSENTAYTAKGTIGVKVWVCGHAKKNFNKKTN